MEATEEGNTSEQEEENFLAGYPTFEAYSKALLSQVVAATKTSTGLPDEGDDYDYYMSFPGFSTFCSKMATRIDRVINKVIRHQQLPCYWAVNSAHVGEPSEATKEEEKFEVLVEANDILLERVSVLLDEVAGLRKNMEQPVGSQEAVHQGTVEVASTSSKRESVRKQMGVFKYIHSRSVTRPQVRFKEKVDNSNNPFIPRIRDKPNAQIPLPEVYKRLEDSTSLSALIANAKEWVGSEAWSTHPYQYELENFAPIPEQLELQEPQQPGSNEDTPLTYIDSLEALEQLRDDLNNAKEFAIDLEHHSYRSFRGFTCLMQVSTRSHDYIVDTLELRHHMHLLQEPFTNPNIPKVMHGANYDVEWLQKDFGLYLVNLFDTGQASRVLQLPKLSLAFLLQYCCQVNADKQYQLADWRIRPLPSEMLQYARDDTHYLLYIYDRMRNELIRRGDKSNHLLHIVLTKSRDLCLKQYKKPVFSEYSYLELYYKHKRRFNSRQLLCLKFLYGWRDHVARDEDESTGYVLPNHMMFQIAEILPREMGGVLACCNPIPILLRQQQHEVFLLVQQARDSPLTDKLPTIPVLNEKSPISAVTTMEMDGSDVSETTSTTATSIPVVGPPVVVVRPTGSVIERVMDVSAPDARVVGVKQVLSKFLLQFEEARVMSASEVLLQQQQAYEALALSNRLRDTRAHSPTVVEHKSTPTQEGEGLTGETGSKTTKRVLSVREMAHEDSPRSDPPIKKPRLSSTVDSDFTPFQYQDSSYTDYTPQGMTRDSYDPHSTGRGRGNRKKSQDFPAAPRSRVQQKSGQKSHTFKRRH